MEELYFHLQQTCEVQQGLNLNEPGVAIDASALRNERNLSSTESVAIGFVDSRGNKNYVQLITSSLSTGDARIWNVPVEQLERNSIVNPQSSDVVRLSGGGSIGTITFEVNPNDLILDTEQVTLPENHIYFTSTNGKLYTPDEISLLAGDTNIEGTSINRVLHTNDIYTQTHIVLNDDSVYKITRAEELIRTEDSNCDEQLNLEIEKVADVFVDPTQEIPTEFDTSTLKDENRTISFYIQTTRTTNNETEPVFLYLQCFDHTRACNGVVYTRNHVEIVRTQTMAYSATVPNVLRQLRLSLFAQIPNFNSDATNISFSDIPFEN